MVKKEPNSTTKSDLPQTPPNGQYSRSYGQPFEEETIDFFALFITLWNNKWLVIAITLVAALGSIVYAMSLPPIYKAESLLLPPKSIGVQSLNVLGVNRLSGDMKLQVVETESVFTVFQKNLSSRTLQKKFINEFKLMEILAPERTSETRDEDIYEDFAEIIKVNNGDGLSISIELHDPNVAAQWVNDYVQFIDSETIERLVENKRNALTNQIRDIEYQIASKRQMAKQRREDQIARFKEALTVARRLGVEERVDTTNVVQNNQLNISTSSTPLYYRGTRALMTEIEILTNRKSDDPFITGLRDLQENLALLRSININTERLHSVSIDQAAYPPKNRIKPNRSMIVTISTAAGLFLGIFLALFASFIMNRKEEYLVKS
ncbi:Wzz/FepE/Etk N-terminal domain-containing protein [Deltaproteobacteria bacterium]|nr:Wzz/FepE/Etk N-terminal domain-containing protein [Deltaproteobacteria bacterium]